MSVLYNESIISDYLKKIGKYPDEQHNDSDGILVKCENEYINISGNPIDLIELAEYLVSLALSGENWGQHWHLDEFCGLSKKSDISELILMRND